MPRAPRVQQSRLKTVSVAAPIGGLNTVASGAEFPPTDSLVQWNMVAAEYGLRTRLGWREWAILGTGEEVRSLLPFTGSQRNGSSNRLFACTQTGIWDVTASGDTSGHGVAPTLVVTWPSQTTDAGWCSSTTFVTLAGHYLVVADEQNGAWIYTENGSTWTQMQYNAAPAGVGQVAGYYLVPTNLVDPTKFAHVMAWKNMLWFTEKDSARAWYLPVNSVGGTAYPFPFGALFQHGGDLRCLANWTFDGGSGVDDMLVAISGGGDLAVYRGSDPSQASGFGLVGNYFLGAVPEGRRITTDFGGDVVILTALGLLPLSKLTSGAVIASPVYETFKVGNLFNQAIVASSGVRGWAARLHPADGTLLILIPTQEGTASNALAMSLFNKGWSQYRGLPLGPCAEAFGGTLYFGTPDGRVCVNDGYLDGTTLAGDVGSPIDFSLISIFSGLGSANQKRVQLIRPTFLSQGGPPAYSVEARYRWDMTEATAPGVIGAAPGATWDNATWDTSSWAGGAYQAQQLVFGAQGVGPQVALATRGTAQARMTLVGWDVAYDEGGLL